MIRLCTPTDDGDGTSRIAVRRRDSSQTAPYQPSDDDTRQLRRRRTAHDRRSGHDRGQLRDTRRPVSADAAPPRPPSRPSHLSEVPRGQAPRHSPCSTCRNSHSFSAVPSRVPRPHGASRASGQPKQDPTRADTTARCDRPAVAGTALGSPGVVVGRPVGGVAASVAIRGGNPLGRLPRCRGGALVRVS